MPISVVIPAHDEEAVVGRCLSALVGHARPGELEVAVVCNGCTDSTAEVARRFKNGVRVIETRVASKTHALNLGDAAVTGFPRYYIDADVELPLESLRRIAGRLDGDVLAAAPSMAPDLSDSSWPVRAFYAIWTRLPCTREGMIGCGVYVLSERGRRRFGTFPDVVADDGFVRMHFAPQERARVDDAPVRVVPPATLSELVRVKARSRMGGFELARRYPALVAGARGRRGLADALRVVAVRPWLWPHACVYLWVNVRARMLARRRLARRAAYVWDRDASSRRAGAVSGGPVS
jgi:glycosyltransferase involved in cell wall biosynthesis